MLPLQRLRAWSTTWCHSSQKWGGKHTLHWEQKPGSPRAHLQVLSFLQGLYFTFGNSHFLAWPPGAPSLPSLYGLLMWFQAWMPHGVSMAPPLAFKALKYFGIMLCPSGAFGVLSPCPKPTWTAPRLRSCRRGYTLFSDPCQRPWCYRKSVLPRVLGINWANYNVTALVIRKTELSGKLLILIP